MGLSTSAGKRAFVHGAGGASIPAMVVQCEASQRGEDSLARHCCLPYCTCKLKNTGLLTPATAAWIITDPGLGGVT